MPPLNGSSPSFTNVTPPSDATTDPEVASQHPMVRRLKRTCPGCACVIEASDLDVLNKLLDTHMTEKGCMEDNL